MINHDNTEKPHNSRFSNMSPNRVVCYVLFYVQLYAENSTPLKLYKKRTTWFTQHFRDQQCLSKSNLVCPLALKQSISLIKH